MDFRAILHHTDPILCTFLHTTVCLKSIQEKILLACLSGPTIQAVSINYPKILSKKLEILSKKLICNFASFQVSVKFWPCSRKNLCTWSIRWFEVWIIHKHWFLLNTVIFMNQQSLNWFWPPKLELIISVKYKICKFNLRKAHHFLTKVTEKHLQF